MRQEEEDELRDRIQRMFDSEDKEMWKMGKLLCHKYRIDYYVYTYFTVIRSRSVGNGYMFKGEVVKYSLAKDENARIGRYYHIKLSEWKSS